MRDVRSCRPSRIRNVLLQTLETAVQMDPLFVIARLDLARYYNHYGNAMKADQLFKEALELHPDSFDGHVHYGEFLFKKVWSYDVIGYEV